MSARTRICPKCRREQVLENFARYRDRRLRAGWAYRACRQCMNADRRRYFRENAEARRRKHARNNERRKERMRTDPVFAERERARARASMRRTYWRRKWSARGDEAA